MTERLLVLVAYLLSGACGLIYEVVWTRHLSLTFGISVFATSAVLAAFMAGLGLGSYLVGRWIDRSHNPIRVYALLEAGIGLYALIVPWIFLLLEPLYIWIGNALEGQFLLFNFIRGLLAFVVLLIPATLMGGTVPAIGRYLVTRPDTVGWNVGILYALNTLGAVSGVLLAGFVMIGTLGMWHTTLLAATLNLAIAATLLLARVGEQSTPQRVSATKAGPQALSRAILVATVVFAFSGFAAMAYEVVWTRVLVIHLHNSTYAFSTMLAVFLLGLTLGDLLLVRFYDRIREPLAWLGHVQVLIGFSVIVAAALYGSMRDIGSVFHTSWAGAASVMFLRAAVVLFPSALLFGMTFPLVARIACSEFASMGADLGRVYAANTVGGVLGSLAGGFLLIPLFGLRGTLLFLSGFNVLLGAACWMYAARGRTRFALGAVALGVLVLPAITIPKDLFFNALQIYGRKLIYYHEGVTDTTGVWEARDGSRVVTYGDARGTAGTGTDPMNRTQGHLAHLLHPNPTRSLQIGFGVGNTLAAAALHPEVQQLDVAELSPHVRETAPFFWTNDDVIDDPKVRLIVDDGRNYLLRTNVRYDVITLEPPDIYTASVVNLYTREFYQLVYDKLDDDGLLCQWFPLPEMSNVDMRMLSRAVQDVFPETTMWRMGRKKGAPMLLVATKQPLTIDMDLLNRRMTQEPVRADLARLEFATPEALFELWVTNPERLRAWIGDIRPVTDDFTYVDFSTPRTVYSGFGFGYFRVLDEQRAESQRHIDEIFEMLMSLREPIEPLLR